MLYTLEQLREENTYNAAHIKAEHVEASEKALPCPFCGCVDIYYRKYQHTAGERWAILCGGCLAEIDCGYAQQPHIARDLWNRRTGGND